jgi:aminopeptidase YwaD
MLDTVLDRLTRDRELWPDFLALAGMGGRFAGTPGERAAQEFLESRLRQATQRPVIRHEVSYAGWRSKGARLRRLGAVPVDLPAHALVRAPAVQALEAEVIDLGRGTPEDFAAYAGEITGKVVLVRHEYMIGSGHIHRRRKYNWAKERGAAGFLIGCHLPGGLLVTGSSGSFAPDDIPGAGISYESAAALAATVDGPARVSLSIDTERAARETWNLLVDIPGRTDERVVLSAHIDGHDLAQSAIDNGTGLAAALAVARAVAPEVASSRRGLTVGFFTIEEWALAGSRIWCDALSEAECDRIVLNVNLDSIAGHPKLTALVSQIPELEPFARRAAAATGETIGVYRPLLANSDHFNFLRRGIPALRLCAGFDVPDSNMRFLLTPGDTTDKVAPSELRTAAMMAATLVVTALDHDGPIARRRTPAEVAAIAG